MKRWRLRAALVGVLVLATAGCDWTMFRQGPDGAGYNSLESAIDTANVGTLTEVWRGSTGIAGLQRQSPVVANGIVYVGTPGGNLDAFRGWNNVPAYCPTPTTCRPYWIGRTGGSAIDSTPAVAGNSVYVGVSGNPNGLFVFDAGGKTNCSAGVCDPVWHADAGDDPFSSPVVAKGTVYVGSYDSNLHAYDAAGNTNCSGSPKTCTPLWTGATGAAVESTPAVANGVVYVGSDDNNLYAFDAAGNKNCSGTPKTCSPLWTAPTGGAVFGGPAVGHDGLVYVTSYASQKLEAFDAAGMTNCVGTPKVCTPVWSATLGGTSVSSPAVANGFVYVGADDGVLYAFDAAGAMNCAGTPKTCTPLWTATTGGPIRSSPGVANGVVYVGSDDSNLYAFDAAGTVGCSGTPKTCSPLWTAATANHVESSPAIAYGRVFVGSGDAYLHAYHLPG